MKDKHKIFIIALLLSLICSLGAVAASEDIAFEQSMNEEDVEASNQNIKEINMKISSKENEALNLLYMSMELHSTTSRRQLVMHMKETLFF